MEDTDIAYRIVNADASFSDFVERFWMLANHSDNSKEITVIPDGRIDLFFSHSNQEKFHAILLGLESKPKEITLAPKTISFGVSLKLPGIEYLLDMPISTLFNKATLLPPGFWGIEAGDLVDFDIFCATASRKISKLINQHVDERKQNLCKLIYSSNGSLSVSELAERVDWSSRQINRYFNKQFGISLKAYCNILRFKASFQHIKEGKLYPEQNFSDQAHFTREVKKLSGVVPKELAKNKNDRFIQFSTLPKK